jgi:hypothetical protein
MAMLRLHHYPGARLEILDSLPISRPRLRIRANEKHDKQRKNDLPLVLHRHKCLNNPAACQENLARFRPIHVSHPLSSL